MKAIVKTNNAPAPIGPYNQAVWHNDTLFMSGQIAINPTDGELIIDTIENETEMVMKNIEGVLKSENLSFDNIIKCSIFISDMDNFARINEVYGKYFTSNYPARECVEVARLPKNVNVEISVIAGR